MSFKIATPTTTRKPSTTETDRRKAVQLGEDYALKIWLQKDHQGDHIRVVFNDRTPSVGLLVRLFNGRGELLEHITITHQTEAAQSRTVNQIITAIGTIKVPASHILQLQDFKDEISKPTTIHRRRTLRPSKIRN